MRLLTEHEAAELLRVAPRSLQRWRATGDGPRFVRLGLRRVAYAEADLLAWAAARSFAHRADEVARKRAAAK
ncbi:helix-turn-helix transcriptional regulator [Rubritepida flocculans]|uniref:helix-turn-helix transcriptional regulator n=1 Tax=Rubritepida flocculans TaxID=182403 RepID=UPI0006860807|nr:helix-turn-helix domain-containing protein [Rubritepida flocculans]